MENGALLYWLITVTALNLLLAGCAVVALRRASPSSPRAKPRNSPPPTQDSENPSLAKLAQLDSDQAALFSTLEKLTTTVKRLSSRAGMREHRAREDQREAPPKGTPKAELLRHYGMSGKVGPAFAQAQLEIDRDRDRDN